MAITLDQLRSFGGVNAMKLDATGENLQSVNMMHRFKSFFNIGTARQENAQTLTAIRYAIQNDPRYHLQGAKEHIDAMLGGIRTNRAIKAADIRRIVATVDQMFANAVPAKREAAAQTLAGLKLAAAGLPPAAENCPTAFTRIVKSSACVGDGGRNVDYVAHTSQANVNKAAENLAQIMGGIGPGQGDAAMYARMKSAATAQVATNIALQMHTVAKNGSNHVDIFDKDFLREQEISINGQRLDNEGIGGKSADEKARLLNNAYDSLAKFVTGNDDVSYKDLSKANMQKTMIMATCLNQALGAVMQSARGEAANPDSGVTKSSFMPMPDGDEERTFAFNLSKTPDGDFKIDVTYRQPICGVTTFAGMAMLSKGSVEESSLSITISKDNLNALSEADFSTIRSDEISLMDQNTPNRPDAHEAARDLLALEQLFTGNVDVSTRLTMIDA